MNTAARGFLWDNLLCMSVYWSGAGTVIASLADYYALPLALTNLITGLTSTLLVVQLWGGLRYARACRKGTFLGISNSLWRILLPLVFFTVLLPPEVGRVAAICIFSLAVAIFQFGYPAQTEWMVGCVEGKVRASYYSTREMCFMLANSGVFCLVSLLLDKAQRDGERGRAFLAIGVLFTLIMAASLVVLSQLPYPPDSPGKPPKKLPIFRIAFSNGPFRAVVLTNTLWSFACIFIGNFATVYQVGVLHIRFFQIMLWTTVANIIRALLTPVMSKLAGRYTWRRVVGACMLLYALVALMWSCIIPETAPFLYPVACILNAIPFAAIGVGFLELQVDTAPPEHRSICFSVFYALSGVGALAGTVVCSALVQGLEQSALSSHTLGLRGIFLLGALCVGLSVVLIMRVTVPDSPNKF